MTKALSELLFACGIVPMTRAKVLATFIHSKGKELTARELERQCDLRQPEVSLALSAFIDRKWITVIAGKEKEGKGRPTKVYVLGVPAEAIYLSISTTIDTDYKRKSELLIKLKSAMIQPVLLPKVGEQKGQLNLM